MELINFIFHSNIFAHYQIGNVQFDQRSLRLGLIFFSNSYTFEHQLNSTYRACDRVDLT